MCNNYRGKVKQFLCACLLPLFLFGCQGAKYLKDNQKLLHRQTVKGPKGFSTTPMTTLYTQEANRKLLGQLPVYTLVWLYYIGYESFNNPKSHSLFKSKAKLEKQKTKKEKKFDKKIASASDPKKISSLQFRKQQKINTFNDKIENGNMAMQWGEPVSVFDTAQVAATIDRMNSYLFNKGYFQGKTSARYTEFKRRVSVIYEVRPERPYFYDSIYFNIPDTAVHHLIQKNKAQYLVKKGDQYDQDKLSKERERIDLLLKDHGYYDFSRQYIDFDVDTASAGSHRVSLLVTIDNPAKRTSHKVFRVDSVSMTPDAGIKTRKKRFVRRYRDVTFSYVHDYYSERILTQRIFIGKDSLYSRTNTFNTQRQLANLDNFKFVNVNYDTSGGKFIANIFASPLDRYSWTNEAGVTVTQGFPGPYYSLSFKKRNIFRGLENFELNGRFGFEGVASATSANNIYKSTEANGNASIIFPQFLFPLSSRTSNRWGKYNPKTRITSGYTYTNRPEYQRSAVNIAGIYTWEKNRVSYSFTAANLNIIRSQTDSAFHAQLVNLQQTQGNNLINSFKPSLVSSMIFSVLWNPNNYGNLEKSSFFLKATAESGGTAFNFFEPKLATHEGLAYYKYVRFNLDIRRNEVINKTTVVAYRVNAGLAYSYGDNNTLPYEKFFFVGGSNSVRAWRPRRLGIGTAPPTLSKTPKADGLFDYQFEKPGEILTEGSLEIRQKFFGFVNLAAFLDVGNVWTFRHTPPATPAANIAPWADKGDTKFSPKEFYKQFGVGTGFGFRFDFSFLVLRLDIGLKVYDPGREEGDRFVLNKVRFFKPYGTLGTDNAYHNLKEPVIYNVGIGYPF
jgi:outer membrane protein insertion porin family